MDIVNEVTAWFADPMRWQGSSGIPIRLLEHVQLSALSVLIAGVVAFPIGMLIGHTGHGGTLAVGIANVGRALPSLALLLMLFPLFGLGYGLALTALVLLAIPPILINTYAALRDVDRDVVEAGRGMGMSAGQLLLRVEIPNALPVILAGVRIAAVQVVATATLAALVGGGGLGRFIIDGFALQQRAQLAGGAILVALLAVATERFFAWIEAHAVSPGVRATETARPLSVAAESGQPGGAA